MSSLFFRFNTNDCNFQYTRDVLIRIFFSEAQTRFYFYSKLCKSVATNFEVWLASWHVRNNSEIILLIWLRVLHIVSVEGS